MKRWSDLGVTEDMIEGIARHWCVQLLDGGYEKTYPVDEIVDILKASM